MVTGADGGGWKRDGSAGSRSSKDPTVGNHFSGGADMVGGAFLSMHDIRVLDRLGRTCLDSVYYICMGRRGRVGAKGRLCVCVRTALACMGVGGRFGTRACSDRSGDCGGGG